MTVEVRNFDPTDLERWETFVALLPEANFFTASDGRV